MGGLCKKKGHGHGDTLLRVVSFTDNPPTSYLQCLSGGGAAASQGLSPKGPRRQRMTGILFACQSHIWHKVAAMLYHAERAGLIWLQRDS